MEHYAELEYQRRHLVEEPHNRVLNLIACNRILDSLLDGGDLKKVPTTGPNYNLQDGVDHGRGTQ